MRGSLNGAVETVPHARPAGYQLGETPAVNRGFFETSMNNMTERQFQSNYRISRHPRSARLRCGVTVSHDGRVTVTVV